MKFWYTHVPLNHSLILYNLTQDKLFNLKQCLDTTKKSKYIYIYKKNKTFFFSFQNLAYFFENIYQNL